MTQSVQIRRTITPNNPPTGLLEGELGVEMANPVRLWVGVSTALDPANRKLLASPGVNTFIGTSPPTAPVAGQLWWKSDLGKTFIYYDDGSSQQWVEI